MQPFSGSLLIAAAMCYPAVALDGDPEITIHIYDYAGVARSVRTYAQESAEVIFHQAGIAVHWRDCPVGTSKTAGAPACGAGTPDVTHFVVAILPASMSARIATTPEQFGTSVMGHAGGYPTQAYVFMDRITRFAADANACSRLLGVITAHEIGHLLLGSDSHSPAGIMRGKWTSDDVKRVLMGVLTFSRRQTELMRAEVRRRAGDIVAKTGQPAERSYDGRTHIVSVNPNANGIPDASSVPENPVERKERSSPAWETPHPLNNLQQRHDEGTTDLPVGAVRHAATKRPPGAKSLIDSTE